MIKLPKDLKPYLKYSGIHPSGEGTIMRLEFDNKLGASIIRNQYSYGGQDGLYELAVLFYQTPDNWGLTYDTDITNDVIGHLTPSAAIKLLYQIKELKK